MHRLFIRQFFSLFAQFKTTKSHENYVFLYPFSNMAISPQNNQKTVFYTGKLYGLTGMQYLQYGSNMALHFTSACTRILKNHYFGGIWPYWKMDTGKHNFHEILLLF